MCKGASCMVFKPYNIDFTKRYFFKKNQSSTCESNIEKYDKINMIAREFQVL